MTVEELIAEAKRRYPIGAFVTNRNLDINCKFTIETELFEKDGNSLLSVQQKTNHRFTVYNDHGWAEIIYYPKNYIVNNNELIFQSL
jgi:hypothetical protein